MDGGTVLGVDTGGTFTDVFSSSGAVKKLPSTPADPSQAIMAGLRAAGAGTGDAVGHGTTVATNAVLERKGARTALLTTAGFEDVLAIRRQNRPALYDLYARWPDPLVPRDRRFGVPERLDWRGEEVRALDAAQVRDLARRLGELDSEAVAVCLLFAYANPAHERVVAGVVRQELGDDLALSLSHEIAPQYGEFERTSTTVLNAYVAPLMRAYLDRLRAEVDGLGVGWLHVMASNGGLVGAQQAAARPVQTVLSGPAGGVVGARAIAAGANHDRIITFDMGGTSTDVAVVPGEVLESSEGDVAGFPVLLPMLTIETVGAGGGSIARVDAGGGLHVGPESAGAVPGPAAYGQGTAPTVTDANLVLGRLSPRGLLGGDVPLQMQRARTALGAVARPLGLSIEQAAWAVIRLANSNMDRAVRAVTLQRGHDPRHFTLFPFGGAGPLHAAELAHALGIRHVLVPPHPGVMAALGLTVPDLRRDYRRTVLLPLRSGSLLAVQTARAELEARVRDELGREELFARPVLTCFLDMRYAGQSFELSVPYVADLERLRSSYTAAYQERYGYQLSGQEIEIAHIHLRVTLPRRRQPTLIPPWPEPRRDPEVREVFFSASAGIGELRPHETSVFWRPSLAPGVRMEGPAVLEQYDSATVLPPGWGAVVDERFNLQMSRA